MMRSMTAFGSSRAISGEKDIAVEIRSVNNRFLDLNLRVPKRYGLKEDIVRAYLKDAGISRGKVDVSITVTELSEKPVQIALNEEYLAGYLDALYTLRDKYGLRDDISVMTVAKNSEIFRIAVEDEESTGEAGECPAWEDIRPVLDTALEAFLLGRTREGERLAEDLQKKLAGVSRVVDRIEECAEANIASYRARLEERLRSVLDSYRVTADESRILTECAIFADKIAVDEELVRLRSHFRTFEEIAASPDPAGRKLDFLMQEINREVNTIGSKSSDATIAGYVVEIKNELEKIREQVQNIE